MKNTLTVTAIIVMVVAVLIFGSLQWYLNSEITTAVNTIQDLESRIGAIENSNQNLNEKVDKITSDLEETRKRLDSFEETYNQLKSHDETREIFPE